MGQPEERLRAVAFLYRAHWHFSRPIFRAWGDHHHRLPNCGQFAPSGTGRFSVIEGAMSSAAANTARTNAETNAKTKASNALLRLDNIAIMRGQRLIQQGLTHDMKAGGITLVTGPNGSGKSSLLRAIAGRLAPAQGSIDCNVPILYVGHQDGLSPALNGRQNLQSWAKLNEYASADGEIEQAIDALNATNFADLPVRVLSRGQRRRFALARLCLGPEQALWLLDEPSAGLDIDTSQLLDRVISRHLDKGGMVMAATHLPLAPQTRPAILALNDINGAAA